MTATCSECGVVTDASNFEGAFLNPRRLVCRVRGDCFARRMDAEKQAKRRAER